MNKARVKRAMKKATRHFPKAKRGPMGGRRLIALAEKKANRS